MPTCEHNLSRRFLVRVGLSTSVFVRAHMTEIAIRVENLSKRYRIDTKQERYRP